MARMNEGFLARFVLAPLSFAPLVACAAPHSDAAAAPETSRSAIDSAAPVEPSACGGSEGVPASDSLALRPPPPPAPQSRPILPPVPPPAPSPYRVELLGDASNRLATFHQAGRTYVLGTLGSRYRIHVTNATPRRVEAVVSVDGLDAIDGTAADYVHKSGYVIAPYGDVTIDGFRTSMEEVATFRFSSVRDSYAAREGADRNVGVIGVAFFPERDRPPPPPPPALPRPARPSYHAPPAPSPPATAAAGASASSRATEAQAADDIESAAPYGGHAEPKKRDRPGLGTEFGEQRSSEVEYTEFQRANAAHPTAVAEVRYNDRDGLIALGIPLRPPAPSELELRETASPFPVNRFASAPPPR
jgi:hypothetical protein